MPLTTAEPDALSRLYATSVFELAQAEGGQARIEEILGELEDILELARKDYSFGEFLSSLILSRSDRQRSLETMFKGRVSDLTLKFLQVLNRKERLSHLPAIVAAYDEKLQSAFGRVEVDVYTAAPIEEAELAAIKSRLHAVLHKEPVLHPYVDASLIGGIRLQIGDQLIDATVATGLRRLRDQLSTRGAAEIRARGGTIID